MYLGSERRCLSSDETPWGMLLLLLAGVVISIALAAGATWKHRQSIKMILRRRKGDNAQDVVRCQENNSFNHEQQNNLISLKPDSHSP